MSDFDRIWDSRQGRVDTSPALPAHIEPVWHALRERPADARAVTSALRSLLAFLSEPAYRTDANCRSVGWFFLFSSEHELTWRHVSPDLQEVLDAMAHNLHDAVAAPDVASSFGALPEQLLAQLEATSDAAPARRIATRPHRSDYPDPISLEAGDHVTVGTRDDEYPGWTWVRTASGNAGWAPEVILQPDDDDTAVATAPYTARELNTEVGDVLDVMRELAGWCWVRNDRNEEGWVPINTTVPAPTT